MYSSQTHLTLHLHIHNIKTINTHAKVITKEIVPLYYSSQINITIFLLNQSQNKKEQTSLQSCLCVYSGYYKNFDLMQYQLFEKPYVSGLLWNFAFCVYLHSRQLLRWGKKFVGYGESVKQTEKKCRI